MWLLMDHRRVSRLEVRAESVSVLRITSTRAARINEFTGHLKKESLPVKLHVANTRFKESEPDPLGIIQSLFSISSMLFSETVFPLLSYSGKTVKER